MTHSEASSAETDQERVAADGTDSAADHSKPAPRDITTANVRQSAIQSLEKSASSERSLAELLDEARELLGTSNPEPSGSIRGQSEATERLRFAEIKQGMSGDPPSDSAETANRFHRSGHSTRTERPAFLQVVAALAAAVIGYLFGHIVAGEDTVMRFFFAATVGMGLFLVFSAFATQIERKWRKRL
jgi:hypothetical protein